ncbi:hybrid sensor histidine kinase/response regulator [Teichococcus oryzae]|uniref:Chemotaxis protein CheA n=1 Tax=Teichococcus oryzae TaxID=1608942 RepID=A0A5B2TDL2_9PROT|nr:hybrid sensor histidine kinase/response regulator [Pseudoroseomonas oryzae]KAA2212586.1 hybrid sensor histidine kinase/response regulator [Pseudoroseomonas oryzae]
MSGGKEDYSQFSLADLFRLESETHVQALTDGLLALERDAAAAQHLEACMRAAHSLKGAARLIDLTPAVDLAHAMEDIFVAAQNGRLALGREQIDLLLRGVDMLASIARATAEPGGGGEAARAEVDALLAALHQAVTAPGQAAPSPPPVAVAPPQAAPAAPEPPPPPPPTPAAPPPPAPEGGDAAERILRITAESLSRLLGLSGEALVEARRLRPFNDRLMRLRRLHYDALRAFDGLRDALPASHAASDQVQLALADARQRLMDCQDYLGERLAELDAFDRRAVRLAHRLYDEALASRMRPFEDGARRYARKVRDLGHKLGKQVRLEILGGGTPVDRDILEHLDAPLGHLLRNAIDHGIELPAERLAAGKPAEGTIRLEARHHAGMLQILVADDGQGIDLGRLRATILARGLARPETVGQLSEAELLEFLFLPGFTMKAEVTEISGRGVGLDAVQAAARLVRGIVRASTEAGRGARFQFELPLTLSVVRTLVVEIGGEPYALPLASIERALKLPRRSIETLEGQQHFSFGDRQIGLVGAHELLGAAAGAAAGEEVFVVIIGDQRNSYGLTVDRLLAQRELVVQPLDARLGKVAGISAAALMEDGSPVLILDVDDLLRGVEKFTTAGRLGPAAAAGAEDSKRRRRRVLVVDDSLTIRELERKLLSQQGYEVEVAVDGLDGWNAARAGQFDLIVTDVDMPRMDGIDLVTLIRKDPHLRGIPVMIVSYKDREEDRRRGLEAGADYYLTKGSFHDQVLVQAVSDLIGPAEA